MLKALIEALKELSLSDKYMLGVSLAILINQTVALTQPAESFISAPYGGAAWSTRTRGRPIKSWAKDMDTLRFPTRRRSQAGAIPAPATLINLVRGKRR